MIYPRLLNYIILHISYINFTLYSCEQTQSIRRYKEIKVRDSEEKEYREDFLNKELKELRSLRRFDNIVQVCLQRASLNMVVYP
jgi:hypothetical protein